MQKFSVAIIGAGIGGLALAQGLKKIDIDVKVYESDKNKNTRPQGYSIYLNRTGLNALEACLSKKSFDTLISLRSRSSDGISFTDEKLGNIFHIKYSKISKDIDGLSIDRPDLRALLLKDLEDVIYFNHSFSYYEETLDGKVRAIFSNDQSIIVDLIVGADGVHSLVRKQLLGKEPEDTNVLALLGKTYLTPNIKNLLLDTPLRTSSCVSAPNGWSAFIGKFEYGKSSPQNEDYVFWSILARRQKWDLKKEIHLLSKLELKEIAKQKTENWHAIFYKLISESEPSSFIFWPLLYSKKTKPWVNSRVTLLGDAMHSMPPTFGLGANSALYDAKILQYILNQVKSDKVNIENAINSYVQKSIKSGFSATKKSLRVLSFATLESNLQRKCLIFLLRFIDFLSSSKFRGFLRSKI